MGTRDMSRWLYDYQELKKVNADVPIITCHDEFLLPSLLEAADGALVGFAGFVPGLIVELVQRALDGDLAGAKEVQKRSSRSTASSMLLASHRRARISA